VIVIRLLSVQTMAEEGQEQAEISVQMRRLRLGAPQQGPGAFLGISYGLETNPKLCIIAEVRYKSPIMVVYLWLS
jgi:hypothetical protein